MPKHLLNLFAILNDVKNPICRIPVTGELQKEVDRYLTDQKNTFNSEENEKVLFSGGYRIDEGEINYVPDFPMGDILIDAIKNPLNYEVLNLREEKRSIKALFFGKIDSDENYVGFQAFDNRKILKKGLTILNSGETYKKLEDPGLTLQTSLTALYENGELLFYSYINTRKFIDLSSYYKEATDSEIDEFVSNDLFQVEDLEALKLNADQIVRKKITVLRKNATLKNVTLKDIQNAARKYNVKIQIKAKKLVLPHDRKQLKDLIKLLDEDYFTAPLSGRKCLTNSKQYL